MIKYDRMEGNTEDSRLYKDQTSQKTEKSYWLVQWPRKRKEKVFNRRIDYT